MKSNDDLKARAEAAFGKLHRTDVDHRRRLKRTEPTGDKADSKSRPVETTEGALWKTSAPQKAERANMVSCLSPCCAPSAVSTSAIPERFFRAHPEKPASLNGRPACDVSGMWLVRKGDCQPGNHRHRSGQM